MEISELTQGFRFYDATESTFIWYDYLCPMPVKNPKNENKYFIVIDKRTETPVRMYKDELKNILDKNLFTLEDTLKERLRLAENWVEYLKSDLKRKTDGL